MKKTFYILIIFLTSLLFMTQAQASGVIFEQVVAVDSGTTYFTSIPDGVKSAIVQVTTGGAVRMTFGKIDVSETVGTLISLSGSFTFRGKHEIANAEFTADAANAGSGASLYVIGFGYQD